MANGRLLPGPLQSPFSNLSSAAVRPFVGSHIDRQSRFAARSARRWGDWGVVEVPTAVLWFDDVYPSLVLDDECEC